MQKKILVLLAFLAFISGCGISVSHKLASDTNVKAADPNDQSIKSIELYISRASLSRAEFEQYKISRNRIFNECGKVYGGRQTSEQQNLVKLDDKDLSEINELAGNILAFNKKHELNLDKPGTSTSMYDAGQFNLKIQQDSGTTEIKTSLDSVTTASKTSEDNLAKLAKKLRQLALDNSNQSLCGNRRFYDL
jgi:hypothetical protein